MKKIGSPAFVEGERSTAIDRVSSTTSNSEATASDILPSENFAVSTNTSLVFVSRESNDVGVTLDLVSSLFQGNTHPNGLKLTLSNFVQASPDDIPIVPQRPCRLSLDLKTPISVLPVVVSTESNDVEVAIDLTNTRIPSVDRGVGFELYKEKPWSLAGDVQEERDSFKPSNNCSFFFYDPKLRVSFMVKPDLAPEASLNDDFSTFSDNCSSLPLETKHDDSNGVVLDSAASPERADKSPEEDSGCSLSQSPYSVFNDSTLEGFDVGLLKEHNSNQQP